MIESTELGKRLKILRCRNNLERPDVARRVGITSNYLGMLEAGKRLPSLEVLRKLTTVYRVNVVLKFENIEST